MSDYVGSLKTIELTFDSDIEVITPELEKIQFTNSGETLLSRPDKLRAHRVGGYSDVTLYFDGKTASIWGKSINGYAQIDAPGTVDHLIETLRAGHGVAMPGADLLLSNPYDVLVADVQEAKYIGRGVINGRECEHLAFRNFDTDWQLWVETGKTPFPRKMVITSKTVNSAPQYTLSVKSWKAGVQPGRDAFSFAPPAGAKSSIPMLSSTSTNCRRAHREEEQGERRQTQVGADGWRGRRRLDLYWRSRRSGRRRTGDACQLCRSGPTLARRRGRRPRGGGAGCGRGPRSRGTGCGRSRRGGAGCGRSPREPRWTRQQSRGALKRRRAGGVGRPGRLATRFIPCSLARWSAYALQARRRSKLVEHERSGRRDVPLRARLAAFSFTFRQANSR